MRPGPVKCGVGSCARDSVGRYCGRSKKGRLAEGEAGGIRYCRTHLARLYRHTDLDAPVRPRGTSKAEQVLRECLRFLEVNGYDAIASELRLSLERHETRPFSDID